MITYNFKRKKNSEAIHRACWTKIHLLIAEISMSSLLCSYTK